MRMNRLTIIETAAIVVGNGGQIAWDNDVVCRTQLCSNCCVQITDLIVVTPLSLQKLTCCSTVRLNLLDEVVNLPLINSYFGIIYWHLVNSRFTLFRAAVRSACSSPMRVDAME